MQEIKCKYCGPVEGWVAKPTKVRADSQCRNQLIDSFDVYECP